MIMLIYRLIYRPWIQIRVSTISETISLEAAKAFCSISQVFKRVRTFHFESKTNALSALGDSGSPMARKINNQTEVIGIVSAGIRCADRKMPGVYTKVCRALTDSGILNLRAVCGLESKNQREAAREFHRFP